jgi:hypothetical protein
VQRIERKIDAGNAVRTPESKSNPGTRLLHVAWLAILLGMAMEVLLLVGSAFGDFPGLRTFVADLVKNVSWSLLVCAGLAVGTTVSKIRVPLVGFLAAPFAFEVSRVLHKGTLEALSVEGIFAAGPSPLLLALIKGVQYGCLGLVIAWIGRRAWGGILAHAATGLVVGMLFGGAILGLEYGSAAASLTAATLLPDAVNEIVFPVGCSLVLFSLKFVGEKMAQRDQE